MSSIEQPPPGNSSKAQLEGHSYPQELPPKLIKRIMDLEYIDMRELLPDFWGTTEENTPCCSHNRCNSRKRPITDILMWLECYSSLVSVLATQHPQYMGHFMAYQRTIIRAHRSFVGEGWITYDSSYRRKAANTKSLEWGKVDFTLYNETFTGRARALPHHTPYSSDQHSSAAPADVFNPTDMHRGGPPYKTPQARDHPRSVCGLFNSHRGNQCTYAPYCKFPQLCATCSGRHPQSRCPLKK